MAFSFKGGGGYIIRNHAYQIKRPDASLTREGKGSANTGHQLYRYVTFAVVEVATWLS